MLSLCFAVSRLGCHPRNLHPFALSRGPFDLHDCRRTCDQLRMTFSAFKVSYIRSTRQAPRHVDARAIPKLSSRPHPRRDRQRDAAWPRGAVSLVPRTSVPGPITLSRTALVQSLRGRNERHALVEGESPRPHARMARIDQRSWLGRRGACPVSSDGL